MTSEDFSRPGAVDLSGLGQSADTPAGGANYVVELTEAEFDKTVARSMQHPVIIEFHSPRDPNGAVVSDALRNGVNGAGGRFLLARVDVDEQPRIAQAVGVQAVPTVIAVIGGQVAPLFQGTKSAEEIAGALDQVAQVAVANGITGRAEPVGGGAPDQEGEAPETKTDPRYEPAYEAMEAGDFKKALAEFDKLLKETPSDLEATAGRAQASLLERSMRFDASTIVENAKNEDDLDAQLDAADLEIIQGAYEQGLDRLLDFATTADADTKEKVRVRLLELFEVIGRTDPIVLKARRRLATVLF